MSDRSFSMLVHGPAKAGKSTLAATAPKPLCYIDAEGGTKFLSIKAKKWDPLREAPPEDDGTWDTAVVTTKEFETAKRVYQWFQSGKHPFRSCAVDSVSEIQQQLIEKVTNRGQAQQNQWGEILREFVGLMRDFRDLTDHPTKPLESVVLVAMSKMTGDGLYHPWLSGQSATVLPYLFDVCAAMTVVNYDDAGTMRQAHRLLIGQNNLYETGERVGGRLPGYIDNANVEVMLDTIFGGR